MDLISAVLIRPHSGLYDYASERYGSPLPPPLWPSTILGMVCAYLAFVTCVGPALMRDRRAFELRPAMLAYNAVQMVVNFWMGCTMLASLLAQGDTILAGCPTPTPWLVQLHIIWLANKFTDLLETIIFVLRKKGGQITFLHLYHHVVVIYYTYMSFVEGPGGYQVLTGVLNSFVHALMYAYYFCSIYDKGLVDRFMDYKQRITQVQMVQFLCLMLHFTKPLFGRCHFPGYLAWSGVIQNGVLFVLFARFYLRTYAIKQPVKTRFGPEHTTVMTKQE